MSISTFSAPLWTYIVMGLLVGIVLLLRFAANKMIGILTAVIRVQTKAIRENYTEIEQLKQDLKFQQDLVKRYRGGFLRQGMTIRRLIAGTAENSPNPLTPEHRRALQALLKDVDLKDF